MDDRFEIIDNVGVIYSGTEAEMLKVWDNIVNDQEDIEWKGDLKLIKIISLIK